MARKEYFLIDHDSTGEGFTPEEMEKYLKHFNLKGKPTGKSDEMGDEYDLEGSDEDLKNLDIDLEAMIGPDYVLPWERENPMTSKTVIDKDGDGDADVTVTKQDDGDDDESLIIGGTDIFKTPFTEKQLAILRGDSDYTKYSKDEFDALQAADYPKARTARNAWIKRARELLDGDDKPHDQGLAGDTTLEEELMLKPSMKPTEFSKKAAEKRGAKPGEPAPDMNFTNDIAKTLASRRW